MPGEQERTYNDVYQDLLQAYEDGIANLDGILAKMKDWDAAPPSPDREKALRDLREMWDGTCAALDDLQGIAERIPTKPKA